MPDRKAEFELTIGDNDTVGDCISALDLPEEEYTVLVNDVYKPMDYCPNEDETITIVYLVLGG